MRFSHRSLPSFGEEVHTPPGQHLTGVTFPHTHAHTHTHIHTHTHTLTLTCTLTHTHMHLHTHAHTLIHTCTHTHTCTHSHAHTHTHSAPWDVTFYGVDEPLMASGTASTLPYQAWYRLPQCTQEPQPCDPVSQEGHGGPGLAPLSVCFRSDSAQLLTPGDHLQFPQSPAFLPKRPEPRKEGRAPRPWARLCPTYFLPSCSSNRVPISVLKMPSVIPLHLDSNCGEQVRPRQSDEQALLGGPQPQTSH